MPIRFLPFAEIRNHAHVAVVDSNHPAAALTLSHWRGAPQLPGLHDDTSTGIVLNALAAELPKLDEVEWVTNNHWDIDGFLGIWALLNPDLALQHADLLRYMAQVGDFRELNPNHPYHQPGLQLVCWLNAVEREQFYAPFDAPESPAKEAKACVPKYTYFLEHFAEMLTHPETGREHWQAEYAQVMADYEALQTQGEITDFPELRLRVVRAPRPVHYYALFAQTESVDSVATVYPDGRYEVEQKYTTWVDVAHRASFPRADLRELAKQLTALEEPALLWRADAPFDTGPLLRPGDLSLNKAQRFDHPTERPYVASSIPPATFVATLKEFFGDFYAGISPKVNWTWEETRALLG